MRTQRAIPIAVLAICGLALLSAGGCRKDDNTETRPAHAANVPTKTVPAAKPASPQLTPAALAERLARFVERAIDEHRARYADAGLIGPENVVLEISAPAEEGSARRALLQRVVEAMMGPLGSLEGVALGGQTNTARGGGAVLKLDVPGNLSTPADRFHILAELDLGDRKIHRHRDAFRVGLVTIIPPSKGVETEFFVRAIRGDFASEFKIVANHYFCLPIGQYETLQVLRPDSALTWSPPQHTVLLSNIWSLSSASAPAVAPVRPPRSVVRPLTVPRPPAPATGGRPSLTILSPSGRSARHVTVSGVATNLDGAKVYIVVHPRGDIDYIQDGRAVVRDSKWQIPRVVLGRLADRGTSFSVRAETVRDGKVISSPPISIIRR